MSDSIDELLRESTAYADASQSDSSTQAREYDWKVFTEWCAAKKAEAMPATPDTATAFLVDQAKTKATATIIRYLSSIKMIYKDKGMLSPFENAQVQRVFEGVKRTKGMAQKGMDAIDFDVIASADLGISPRAVRDRAVVLFGMMTALRGTEICALDIEDLEFREDDVIVSVRKSKTDQYKVGRTVSVPYASSEEKCPVVALEKWLDLVGEETGPVFRGLLCTGKPSRNRITRGTVWSIVKAVAATAKAKGTFGAHSLRAGYVTAADKAGATWDQIKEQTGHTSNVVKRYSRHTRDPLKASKSSMVLESAISEKAK
jgi:integrase